MRLRIRQERDFGAASMAAWTARTWAVTSCPAPGTGSAAASSATLPRFRSAVWQNPQSVPSTAVTRARLISSAPAVLAPAVLAPAVLAPAVLAPAVLAPAVSAPALLAPAGPGAR